MGETSRDTYIATNYDAELAGTCGEAERKMKW